MNWKQALLSVGLWFRGLVAAAIGGGATAVTMMAIDSKTFNLDSGLAQVKTVFLVSAGINVMFYLKASPLPGVSNNVDPKPQGVDAG